MMHDLCAVALLQAAAHLWRASTLRGTCAVRLPSHGAPAASPARQALLADDDDRSDVYFVLMGRLGRLAP